MLFFQKNLIKPAVIIFVAIAALITTVSIPHKSFIKNTATCDELGEYSLKAETQAEQAGFLFRFGLKAEGKPVRTDRVMIPSDFGDIYTRYNKLQKPIGLDLSPYKGKEAERVVYKLESGKLATLLIYRGRVIGGHIASGIYGEPYTSVSVLSSSSVK